MKNNLVLGMLLGTLTGGVLTAAGMLIFVSDSAVQETAPEERSQTSAPSARKAQDDEASCEDKLARLRRAYNRTPRVNTDQSAMLDELEEMLIKSGGASPDGTPMEFPENLPYAHTPKGFEEIVERMRDECPDFLPEDAEVDCTEFPCMIVGTTKERPRWNTHQSCDAWSQNFSGSGLRYRSLHGEEMSYAIAFRPSPRDDEDELRDHIEEYKGNYEKRNQARTKEFFTDALVANARDACEVDGNGRACYDAGVALEKEDWRRASEFLEQGCDVGTGSACNHLAWTKCHDNNECDEDALTYAEQAVELRPNDGRGALDTLAYVLCQRGDAVSSNEMYRRSCEAGYKQNCNKTCG